MHGRHVKFGLKIPNRLGKMSENLRVFFTHTVYYGFSSKTYLGCCVVSCCGGVVLCNRIRLSIRLAQRGCCSDKDATWRKFHAADDDSSNSIKSVVYTMKRASLSQDIQLRVLRMNWTSDNLSTCCLRSHATRFCYWHTLSEHLLFTYAVCGAFLRSF